MKLHHILYLFAFLLTGCVSFEKAVLPEAKPRVQYDASEEVEVKKLTDVYEGGIISDFEKDIKGWYSEHGNVFIAKKGGALAVKGDNVGPGWEQLHYRFKEPVDFSETQNLIVKARKTGNGLAYLRVELIDGKGHSTNKRVVAMRIVPSEEYMEYKLVFEGAFAQNYPNKAPVDITDIRAIMIYINGGSSPLKGTIFIDEIKAVKEAW